LQRCDGFFCPFKMVVTVFILHKVLFMPDKIIFNIASIPSRQKSLHQVVLTLIPQTDEIHIYLNDYEEIPFFLYHPNITVYRSQEHIGDIGDVGKFYNVENEDGYIFTGDDDIIYPPSYCADMIRQIEKHHRKTWVSCHGRVLHEDRPSQNFYTDYKKAYNFTKYCEEGWVHVPGTGVSAFHSDTLRPPLSIFETCNMADIWISLYLQKKKIPASVMQHNAGYLSECKDADVWYSIWAACHKNCETHTNLINSIKWNLNNDHLVHHPGL
jgi:hypothetical protein